jgi:D-alanyl-D-alanine dipeptidase
MANELIPIGQYGLLGSSFYWNRYADYGLTREDLISVGMRDDQIYVSPEIIPVLLKIDKELQSRGWRLYLKEGYRSKELYKLLYERRVAKYGQEMTDKLLNIKDMKHSSGLSVDVTIWDTVKNQEIHLRRSGDGPESLLIDFYKDSTDPEGQRCQELQKYLIETMIKHGFKLGERKEYFHFDYR